MDLSRTRSGISGLPVLPGPVAGADGCVVVVPGPGGVEIEAVGGSWRCPHGRLWFGAAGGSFRLVGDAALVLRMPRAALVARGVDAPAGAGRTTDCEAGPGALFAGYLRLVAGWCGQAAAPAAVPLDTHLLDLLVAAVGGVHGGQRPGTSRRDGHLARIRAYIERNVSDPDLTPRRIAAACAISPRYLNALFRGTGRSVSGWIRDARLELAYRALDRGDGASSIAQLAYGVGFGDHARFSRAFKQRYGCPPSALRKGAGAGPRLRQVAP